jgi:hypothetical protein
MGLLDMASINSSTVSYRYPLALDRFFRVIISFFSIFLIFLVMTPAVLAQNDEITISYSGRLQYGCTLTIKVRSKCNEIIDTPSVTFDNQNIPITGDSSGGFIGEVVLNKVGTLWIEAANRCKRTRRQVTVTEMVMKTSLAFMDPEDAPLDKQVANINLTLYYSSQGTRLVWDYQVIPWNLPGRGESLVTGSSTTTYALGMGSDIRYPSTTEPTRTDLLLGQRRWTGWARWADISWNTVCGENYLTAQQPFIR